MNTYDGRDGEDFRPDDEDFGTDMITMNPPRWQRWRHGRPITVAGVAVVALAGGAGIGYAATTSASKPAAATTVSAPAAPTPSASPAPGSGSGSGPGHGWRAYGGGIPGGPTRFARGPLGAGLIHGEFTEPKSGGGYQTIDVQVGTVTAVSGTSVTVKSADGYTVTYTVTSKTVVDAQAAGIGSVKKGDSIFVTATVSGSTPTAADIQDLTAIKAGRASFGFPGRPANPPAQALPAQAPNA